ncbi:hypothetical protein B296_00044413 [Ensete ventricosum]|uniref:FF domain-containing protein n=1 Tax=Ensete ventricosum TaxID=4639 RepID=A0A426ZB78_ENSVE|nr:hypothetical protein B296_00044413 [Ensete ventricosum]
MSCRSNHDNSSLKNIASVLDGTSATDLETMRVIINDKRYGALKTLGERKQAFNEYLGQRKKQEAEERRIKQKKAREDFTRMLEVNFIGNIFILVSSCVHCNCSLQVKDLPPYLAVASNASGSTPKDLFEDVAEELQKLVFLFFLILPTM